LNALGYNIDLIATDSKTPTGADLAAVHAKVRNVLCLPRKRRYRQALSLRPYQVENRRELRAVPLSDEYDFVLLETEYVADILLNKDLKARYCLLRVHNNEIRYYRSLSKSCTKMIEKSLFFIDSIRFRLFLPTVWDKFQQLWFISDSERKEFVAKRPWDASKAFFIPPRIDSSSMFAHHSCGMNVLFIGALTRSMNMRGLRWYLTTVHPKIKVDGYRLLIAGYTGGESTEWLAELCRQQANIVMQSDVADLGPLYRNGSVFVNPILSGAGLKLKTIHALEAGLPVVTTDVGAEGTGLRDREHILIANSSEEFARSVCTLLVNRKESARLVRAAQAFLREAYDQEKLIASCLKTLSAD
jgi:glycosyltransferase involved in cell wall biosynthesis